LDLVAAWLAKAEEDLLASRAVLVASMPSYTAASFHAQQAAEKALKALLVQHQVEFTRTHDIGELLELLEPATPGITMRLAEAELLTRHAVQTRYPTSLPSVDRDEAARDIEVAEKVVSYVRAVLRPYLDSGRPIA
jgi:HEPN domain-containing protein